MPNRQYNPSYEGETESDNQVLYLLFAAFILIIAWFIPYGKFIFYPLTLFATWFHEVGHAIASVIVGGRFVNIQIFSDLGGLNYSLIPDNLSNLKRAFIAAGGPVMPAIMGGLLIISGKKEYAAKFAILLLAASMFLSIILSMPTISTGMSLVAILAIGLGYAALNLSQNMLRLIVHILGIEGAISIFADFSYLSHSSGMIGNQIFKSDTQQISDLLGSNPLFWAILLTTFSLAVMISALLYSVGFFKKKSVVNTKEVQNLSFSAYYLHSLV